MKSILAALVVAVAVPAQSFAQGGTSLGTSGASAPSIAPLPDCGTLDGQRHEKCLRDRESPATKARTGTSAPPAAAGGVPSPKPGASTSESRAPASGGGSMDRVGPGSTGMGR